MFCQNCGKEVPDGIKFCPDCGATLITGNRTESDNKSIDTVKSDASVGKNKHSRKTKRRKNPVKKVLLIVLIIIVALGIMGGIIGSLEKKTANNTASSNNIDVVFDASKYAPDNNGKTITVKELKDELGRQDKVEKWKFKAANGKKYEIKTLIYGNTRYNFYDDNLARIEIDDEIEFSDKNDIPAMFNLKVTSDSEVTDVPGGYRVYNCPIHDLWCTYDTKDDKKISITYITYADPFLEE